MIKEIFLEGVVLICVGLFQFLLFISRICVFFQFKYYDFRKIPYITQRDKFYDFPMRIDK